MGKDYRAYRFRMYPGPDQEEQMAKTFGCCRFIHNHMLEDKIREYNEKGKLAREQRKLSRCRKGSRNYVKQKRKVARCHEKIRNQRRDYQNKLSFYLSEEYDAVCVEDLNMKGMSRGLHLGKSVMDNANGRFQRILEEKLVRKGKAYVRVDRYFPSSKRCSCCGRIRGDLKLSDRIYECGCGYRGDRDINAAINLKQEGIRILYCAER